MPCGAVRPVPFIYSLIILDMLSVRQIPQEGPEPGVGSIRSAACPWSASLPANPARSAGARNHTRTWHAGHRNVEVTVDSMSSNPHACAVSMATRENIGNLVNLSSHGMALQAAGSRHAVVAESGTRRIFLYIIAAVVDVFSGCTVHSAHCMYSAHRP